MKNINDLARITGYSKSTISRALNHKGRISSKTREKIMKAAQEMNYLPNSKAVSLSTGKSHTLGILVPYSTFNSYYDKIMHSIINEAFHTGYKVIFLPTHYDPETELGYLKMFQAKEFDGLIIVSATNPYPLIANYLQYGTIISCEETGNSGIGFIKTERTEGYAPALKLLKNKGIEQIGLCLSRTIQTSTGAREVFNFLKKEISKFDEKMIFENCRNFHDGIKAAQYFISLTPKIEAIFANSDEIAAGILKSYQEANLQPPIVIGQENQAIGELLNIPTIDFKLNELGREVVRMCLNKSKAKRILKSQLIIRGNI